MAFAPARRAALWTCLIAASAGSLLLVAEICGNVYFGLKQRRFFYSRTVAGSRLPVSETWPQARARLAPYFGFSNPAGVSIEDMVIANRGDPETVGKELGSPAWMKKTSNNYGFFSDEDYPAEPSGALSVGIFGGSVAERLAVQGGNRLRSRLAEVAPKVRILNFAQAGYKQPQQLLVLAYYLSLGQKIDVVVNVDGLNDAAMGLLNDREGFAFSMPWIPRMRSLGLQATSHFDPETELYLARVVTLKHRVRRLQERRRNARFAASYMLADLRLGRAEQRFRELVAGPPVSSSAAGRELIRLVASRQRGDVRQRIARHWARSSEMMARLARDAGAHYLHLLQPNQYAGARAFGRAEKRRAINPRSPFRGPVRELYPLFREQGAMLASAGIHFVDATGLFDEVSEPIYIDDCCHYTQLGNEILADLVAERIRQGLETGKSTTG